VRRLALAVAPLMATAVVAWSCGGDVWSFDYPDASTDLTAESELEAGAPDAAVADARANQEESAPPPSNPPGQGCPPPDAGFHECVVCANDDDCTKSAIAQEFGFLACGLEKRCVECTPGPPDTCPNTSSGPQTCVDEHCVTACTMTADCPGKAFCSSDRFDAFDAGFNSGGFSAFDAGFCLECGLGGNGVCGPSTCNGDQICVECTDGGCGMGGTCSQYGYCVGIASRDGG